MVIEVNGLTKRFKAYESKGGGGFLASLSRKYYMKTAVDDLSFSVREGTIVALLGRNGSGKSTLIKLLTGIIYPDAGTVKVLGRNPWTDRVRIAQELGVVFGAHGQLYWNLPAMDTFELIKRIYHIPDRAFEERLSYFIDALDLGTVYKRQVRTLSLGEQMKCNFVASVLHRPRLVLLDEPTIGVDLPSKAALRNTLLYMQKKFNTTFVITTHIVEDITIAQRIILLDKGRKIFDDEKAALENVFGDTRHLEVYLRSGSRIDLARYGRILTKAPEYAKLEIAHSQLKSRRIISLLASDDVMDYKVTEPGLTYILTRLYRSFDKRRRRRVGVHV